MLYFRDLNTGAVFVYDDQSARERYGAPELVAMTPQEVHEHLNPPAPQPTTQELQARFTQAIQARLDAWARTRNYDGVLSATTYATSTVPKFQAEGQRAVELRDQTWAAAYAILAEVLSGTRPMPASLADIEADLPVLEWPQ